MHRHLELHRVYWERHASVLRAMGLRRASARRIHRESVRLLRRRTDPSTDAIAESGAEDIEQLYAEFVNDLMRTYHTDLLVYRYVFRDGAIKLLPEGELS